MTEYVSSAGGIEFTLNVVPFFSAESCPSREVSAVGSRIKPIGHADPDKVANDIAIVEIIPDKDFDSHASSLKRGGPRIEETSPTLLIMLIPLVSPVEITDSMYFNARRRCPSGHIT